MEVWTEAAPTMPDLRDAPSGYSMPLVVVPQKQCSKRRYKDPKSRTEQIKEGDAQRIACIETTVAQGCFTDPSNSQLFEL